MASDSRWLRAVRATVRHGAVIALALAACSLALRFSVRDRIPVLCVVYLATPVVLDGLAGVVAAVVAWRLRRRRIAIVAVAIAVVSTALYARESFLSHPPGSPGAIRGVFWNVGHGDAGWQGVSETLAAFDADVMWLAEAGDGTDEADDVLRKRFPTHTLSRAAEGLVVLVRGGRSEFESWERLPHHGRLGIVRITTLGRRFTTVFADVGALPGSRLEPLGMVLSAARPRFDHPLLVLGDLNTPRDSVAFDAWRGPLTHAFETVGHGLDATWPLPVPVLSIDHVWSGGGIRVRTCELPWTTRSDHLPVVFTFDVP